MITVSHLTKTYDIPVLHDVSFTAPPGKVTGFLGPNGAGKTTTFRCLLGLATPTGGTALINGVTYAETIDPRRTVGAVLESTGFHPARTGRNHLRVIARAARIETHRVDDLLRVVGLTSAANRRVGGYSLGMRQRLGIAAALLGDPAVLILDEPTNGLDPEGVAWLRSLTRSWADEGRAVVVSSHLLAEVSHTVDRVVIIRDGCTIAEGDIADFAGGGSVIAVDRPQPLITQLERRGITHTLRPDGSIAAQAIDPAALGELATGAGLTISRLGVDDTASGLEATFLQLTATPEGAPR
jgi:ABC-2 type transport system ATP-binding protein